MAESRLPGAVKFVNAHRVALEKTSAGMKALGKQALAIGEYQRGAALLTRAVTMGPSDLDAAYSLGLAHLRAGDVSEAADIFNTLIRFRPEYPLYYAALGVAYREEGRIMESSAILETAAKMAPDNIMILVNQSHACLRLGWYEKAERLLLRARDIAPHSGDIGVDLGIVYWYEGKEQEAMRSFEAAAEIPASRQSSYNNLGDVLFRGGSIDKALEAYSRALKAGPTNQTVLCNTARAYLAEGKPKKAARYFDRLLARGARPPRYSDTAIGDRRDARPRPRRGDVLPEDPQARAGTSGRGPRSCRHPRQAGKVPGGAGPVADYLDHDPQNREFMDTLASIYLQMGDYGEALARYRTVVRSFPDDPDGYIGVGQSMYGMVEHKNSQDYDEAIQALKLACIHAPQSPLPDMLMGDIYADFKGYLELAVDHWKVALAKASDGAMRNQLQQRIAGLQ